MEKVEIIKQLKVKHQAFISFFEQQDDALFHHPIASSKWSYGQHAEHILLSLQALNKAIKMPKLVLRTTFGIKNERPERTYKEVVEKYKLKLAEGNVAATNPPGTQFAPATAGHTSKEEIMDGVEKELSKMTKIVGKWSEKDLTKYLIPHPLLGKMTVREILFFTIYHAERHTKAIKKVAL